MPASTSVPTTKAITTATGTPRSGPWNQNPLNHEPLNQEPRGPGSSGGLSITGGEGDSIVVSAGDEDMLDGSRNRFSGLAEIRPGLRRCHYPTEKLPRNTKSLATPAIRIRFGLRPCSLIFAASWQLGRTQSFAVIVASPTLVQSSKGDADGRSRPGFMMLSGSSPPLIAATASTPSDEISSVNHGKCSVPTAW